VDGVPCTLPLFPTTPIQSSGYSTAWPLAPEPSRVPPDQPFECAKGPPTVIRFEFASEFGLLTAEFVWSGRDVTQDIEVPLPASPSPSPAAELPPTGGTAVRNGGSFPTLVAAALTTLINAGLGCAMIVRFPHRRQR
jgi:hypothetical protein